MKVSSSRILCVLLLTLFFGAFSCRRATEPSVEPGLTQVGAEERLAEADQLWKERKDLNRVRQAVVVLRQVRAIDFGNYEAGWKLSRALYYLGAHTEDERERDDAFRDGAETAKIAIQLRQDRPEGHFWLGANYGGSAQHSALASLANVEEIRRAMETVLKIDDTYESGSAYMVLGQLYMEAPRLLGGDTQKAIEYLERGLKVGPENAFLRLRLAEAYHAARRNADARKQVDFLFTMTPHPDYLPEHEEAVEEAKKLRKEVNRKS